MMKLWTKQTRRSENCENNIFDYEGAFTQAFVCGYIKRDICDSS